MTDPTPPVSATVAPHPSRCPIPLDALPPALRRGVDPASPPPLRTMAAKGLLPAAPRDLLTALFILSFDPLPAVARTAVESATKLAERVLGAALRDEEIAPPVLSFCAQVFAGNDAALELVALNPATTDEAFADLGRFGGEQVTEIVAQNQLRVLRDERIVRALAANARVRRSTLDGLLDFCVRSGLRLPDVPGFDEARRRVLGADEALARELADAELESADKLMQEFGNLTAEGLQVEEARRFTLAQRVLKMSVAEKVKLASRGNREARLLLVRDPNKLVALAAVENPRLQESDVVVISNIRTLCDDVMRYICQRRDWMRSLQIRNNLVNNPRTPVAVAVRTLQSLGNADLKFVSRNRNIPMVVQNTARTLLQTRSGG